MSRGSGFVRSGAMALALLCGGCMATVPGLDPEAAAGAEGTLGTFEVSTFGLARAEIAPTLCRAGDTELYLGGDLIDEKLDLAVRLVVDPLEGPALRVYDVKAPFERSVVFFHELCERFEMQLAPTGWIVNDVLVRELELDVDCVNEEGATIRGRAQARCD